MLKYKTDVHCTLWIFKDTIICRNVFAEMKFYREICVISKKDFRTRSDISRVRFFRVIATTHWDDEVK